MRLTAVLAAFLLSQTAVAFSQATPPEIVVDKDNISVSESCRLMPAFTPIGDADDNGVVHITGRADGQRITIDLGGGMLLGGAGAPESFKGRGIVVSGKNVTLRNGSVRGYRIGIQAENCDGLVIEDFETSDNSAQLLGSTAWAEAPADWLFPHNNDKGEWIAQHGAGIAVRNAEGVSIRRIKNYRTQNGIVLDRVNKSEVFDNDCSFLSGWGIAMWRSSGNTVCRNSLDFCVRGYSHGVYNRGQDSAGLLMFEQCSDNIVALNSATHCGDGIFGFAGREALGETPGAPKPEGDAWHRGRGSNRNMFIGNDLSDSAAHGLEMTFGFGNVIARNRFETNAICGIWAGYGRDTVIVGNAFERNGLAGYGAERGGVNMEHAQRTVVEGNTFSREPVGVRFWTDEDASIAHLPWCRANGMQTLDNRILTNRFVGCDKAAELIAVKDTVIVGNTLDQTKVGFEQKDCTGTVETGAAPARSGPTDAEIDAIIAKLPGKRRAFDGRSGFRGREKIVMLEHGPYEWNAPIVVRRNESQWVTQFTAYGFPDILGVDAIGNAPLFAGRTGNDIEMRSNQHGFVAPYILQVRSTSKINLRVRGCFVAGDWNAKFFDLDGGAAKLAEVPDRAAMLELAKAEPRTLNFREINFDFKGRAPQDAIDSPDAHLLKLQPTRFGMTATTSLRFNPGRYRVRVLSDDGVRLTVDGKVAIERWDIHVPTEDSAEIKVDEMREIPFELEYFQNTGSARLKLWFEVIEAKING